MPSAMFKTPISLVLLVVTLAACSTVPTDLGRSEVDTLLSERGQQTVQAGQMDATASLVRELAGKPLSPESAIRIALLNNPQLKAAYARLGFGAADVYEAGRIRNPVLSASLLFPNISDEQDQLSLGLVISFTDLITLPARKSLSASAFAALQQSIGAEAMGVAADAERSYYAYVGAKQVEAMLAQMALAGRLSAELAARYHAAGNINARNLALERAAASEAQLAALDAAASTFAARVELANVMGLSAGESWSVPGQLDLPLPEEDDLNALIALAERSRLDLAAARTEVDMLADQLGVVKWTRWLGDLDAGIEREWETDGSRLTGPAVDWELPIFTQHRDQVLRADASLQIAIYDLQRLAMETENSVRLAYARLENSRSRVDEYRQALIPQRIEAVAREQEEVNFMLIGIFDLLQTKQQEYNAYEGYLLAIRDYWLARVDLAQAVGTALPSTTMAGQQRIRIDDFLRTEPAEMDHSKHGPMKKDHSKHGSMKMDHSSHAMPGDGGMSPMAATDEEKNGDQP